MDQENSENGVKTEGIIISTEEQFLELKSSEIEGKHVKINSSDEKPGSEQQNCEIGAKKERISSSYKEPSLEQDNSEVERKRDKSSNSYEEQRTICMHQTQTKKKEDKICLFLRTTR